MQLIILVSKMDKQFFHFTYIPKIFRLNNSNRHDFQRSQISNIAEKSIENMPECEDMPEYQ